MAIYLQDLEVLQQACREFGASGLAAFLRDDLVAGLGWPDDVLEQWLYDHASWFVGDYGHLDLETITWHDELVSKDAFLTMPTGPSDGDLIDENAAQADHWSEVRRHLGVPQHWASHGTWMRRPILIDRSVLYPGEKGLQVIEGRTRVGILRGFVWQGRAVADGHAAWVARAR